ncbi:cupin domain-containing protein [Neolewinella litorea]|uniref:Cupin domain-containing protein n=2 Tax=Neolewinella litorea TaxID=2562452 RepID=A0A4V3XK56_9BACT|nr:cupin domain-containing protein [Neolewinella litorea]
MGCAAESDDDENRLDNGFQVRKGEPRPGKQYHMKAVTRNRMDVKISGDDTRGSLAVFEQQGQSPGIGPPLHIHPHQDEWMHILEGSYLFQVGQAEYQAGEGDTIYMPRGVQHAFVQLSDQSRMLVSYAPAGKMEAFFKATSEASETLNPDQMARLFKDHDMEIVGGLLSARG